MITRRRDPTKQIIGMLVIAFAVLGLVGAIASWLDPSSEAERACVTKSAGDFMRCVYDARHPK